MSIILFIIILLLLILVHEFGHFIVAKKSGIRVDEFGIGFPPRAMRLAKKGETEYTLNWLPFGGFVKIFGENPNDESISGPDKERSFVHKPKLIQVAVLSAGVIFNVLLAWFLFWVVFVIGAPTALSEDEIGGASEVRLIIADVLENTPAELAGLEPGDEILTLGSVDANESVTALTPSSVIEFVGPRSGETLFLSLGRGNEILQYEVAPETGLIQEDPERAAIGISMGLVGLVRHDPIAAIWESARFTVEMTGFIAAALSSFFFEAFTLQADLSEVAGPVGIVGLVGDASALGFVFVLNFTAIISINLAIINLLPFPALDGGRILFVIIETIKGSPIKPAIANSLNTIGFAILLLLMLVVTYSDIVRIVTN